MDGEVFPCSLQRIQQKEPVGLQGLSDGELQTSNSQPTPTGYQQVSGVYQEGQTEDEVCKGSAEELLGERHQ